MLSTGGVVQVPVPGGTVAPTSSDIRNSIMQSVGNDKFDATESNPYVMALDWIIDTDPMNLTVSSPNLIQRYTAAYLYYATSRSKDWTSCGQAKSAVDDQLNCIYLKVVGMDPIQTTELPEIRWLSSVSECNWVGMLCDGQERVRGIELRKFIGLTCVLLL
jgi:hypothetical protein